MAAAVPDLGELLRAAAESLLGAADDLAARLPDLPGGLGQPVALVAVVAVAAVAFLVVGSVVRPLAGWLAATVLVLLVAAVLPGAPDLDLTTAALVALGALLGARALGSLGRTSRRR